MYIEKIQSPKDIKSMNIEQLNVLAAEIREALIQKLSVHGGHVAPNLGMVEATIALHYVFNSPLDKIVFDISHQSYTHKILTGRAYGFIDSSRYDDVSGYSEPCESEHDHFIIGHTSTSVSLACGLAKGRDLLGGKENIIAVIGDGSISGGEALEGLDVVAEQNTNMIILFNDNQMSIAENHGGLYAGLDNLRETNGKAENNLFKAFGLDYVYVDNGNDIKALIDTLSKVKDSDHPVVVHINTLKGKGYKFAEENKEAWHWNMPFDIETGKNVNIHYSEDYGDLTAQFLLEKMKNLPSLVFVNAATPGMIGFTPERRAIAGKQYVDVGICEPHAVAMVSGIAKRGAHPVFGVVSSFVQRTYDQISQDLCINNSPATIIVVCGSLGGMNDVTHLGHFDIPMMSNIPNLTYFAPTCVEEYFDMLEWSITYNGGPVAIRIPGGKLMHRKDLLFAPSEVKDYTSVLGKYEQTHSGESAVIIGLGSMYSVAEESVKLLESDGINMSLVNPRAATFVDKDLLDKLSDTHSLFVTLEDGQNEGGFGEKVAHYLAEKGKRVLVRGGNREFLDRYDVKELYYRLRMTPELIKEDVKKYL